MRLCHTDHRPLLHAEMLRAPEAAESMSVSASGGTAPKFGINHSP